MKRARRVAVLGATGFVGRNVWDELKRGGYEVEPLSRSSGCDLQDLHKATRVLQALKPDYLVNCAAYVGSVNFVSDFTADVVDLNMRMLLNLYKAAQQLRDVVLLNPIANCGYPSSASDFRETDFWAGPPDPSVLSYGSTRRMIEVLSKCYQRQYGLRSCNLFVPNMYGPYDSTNPNKTHALNALVIKFVSAVKRGEGEVEVWGSGKPVREWLYVKDFARLLRRVIDSGEHFAEPVNVAQARGLSVDELVAIIARDLKFKGRVVKNASYPDGTPKKVMDDALFRRRFPGFDFTGLDAGLSETIDYYRGIL